MDYLNVKINIKKIIIGIAMIILFSVTCNINQIEATTTTVSGNLLASIDIADEEELSETIKNLMLTIGSEGMTKDLLSQTISLYNKITDQYSNAEIATMIEDNRKELETNGMAKSDIETVTKALNNIDSTQLKKVLETINIDELSAKIEKGESLQSTITGITSSLSATEKVDLVVNLLMSAYVIKWIVTAFLIIFVYRTLLRCVIYKKAGKKAWAPFIPIYRNIVMLKICGMNPWWMLLLFVPIIGWAFLWVVSVASKFMLAEAFGKKVPFAFGLWLLAPIFETILVISWRTKYIGFEEEE